MPETTSASQSSSGGENRREWPQLRELLASRYELAELEIRGDIESSRRFGIVGGSGLVMALTGLPVLVMLLSGALAAWTQTDPVWWQLGLGFGFLLVGLAILWLSWRTFRREFAGLRETLEELREDAAWMKEMAVEFTPLSRFAQDRDPPDGA